MADADEREYRAIIWTADATRPVQRGGFVLAKGLEEPREKLERQYSESAVFDLNKEDDAKMRAWLIVRRAPTISAQPGVAVGGAPLS
jgi:hypothetical protein